MFACPRSVLPGVGSHRYTHMTPVQAGTLPIIISGVDVLAKAKTGTGKTLAFLIPSIEVSGAAFTPRIARDVAPARAHNTLARVDRPEDRR